MNTATERGGAVCGDKITATRTTFTGNKAGTNTVEGYHRQIRKVTKNKGVFPSDTALEKLVYLAYRNISEKWTMPLANWALISQQLAIKFGDRYEIM